MASEQSSQQTPPSANKRRQTSLRVKLALAGVTLIFGFLLAETGVRYLRYKGEQTRHEQWAQFITKQRNDKIAKSSSLAFGDLIVPSEHPDVIYEMCPDLDVVFQGKKVSTNADGFRGPLIAKNKPDGAIRIVGIGDSVMFGLGVNDGEEYMQVMAKALQDALPDRRVEVVNMAISGFNTGMEVDLLHKKGLAYKPDLVVIDFVRNDFNLPNFISGKTNYLSLTRCFLLEWIASIGNKKGGFAPLTPATADKHGAFESDPELVPPQYSHLVGHGGYKRALKRLKELSAEHGFKVVVTTHRYKVPVVLETCKELGLPLVFGEDAVSKYEKEHGIDPYLGSELTVSKTDPHPSKLQHRILGEHYAQLLLNSELLD